MSRAWSRGDEDAGELPWFDLRIRGMKLRVVMPKLPSEGPMVSEIVATTAPPPDDSFRVLQFTPPMPLTLYSAMVCAIGEACAREGYQAFFTESDGAAVVHVKKVPDDDDER